jgi:hypothetical protein
MGDCQRPTGSRFIIDFGMRLLFNILAISGSAAYAGVMLAIGVILGGYWKGLSAADFLDSFVANLPFIAQFAPSNSPCETAYGGHRPSASSSLAR